MLDFTKCDEALSVDKLEGNIDPKIGYAYKEIVASLWDDTEGVDIGAVRTLVINADVANFGRQVSCGV